MEHGVGVERVLGKRAEPRAVVCTRDFGKFVTAVMCKSPDDMVVPQMRTTPDFPRWRTRPPQY